MDLLISIQSAKPQQSAIPGVASNYHLFQAEGSAHVYLSNGSRVYSLPTAEAELLGGASDGDALLEFWKIAGAPYVDDRPVKSPPVRSLSLAVAQKCNLGCVYCYAQEGTFGGAPRDMEEQTARGSVDLLLADLPPGERAVLAFLGGEPLINRRLIQSVTAYAVQQAGCREVALSFSITTNGTLVTAEDAAFFEEHGFAVTISLDGVGEDHDRLRSFKGGQSSYKHILDRIEPLLSMQRKMQVSARVTVTPLNLNLERTLQEFVDMGFHSVGFSPMLSAPSRREEMGSAELEAMLAQMIACGREFERHLLAGRRYPFANLINAVHEIHKGTHRPYPCGAGAGYLGVSADGNLYACHRFVDEPAAAMGNVATGIDRERQNGWLQTRHVHRQEPCRSCWARYLCGGGCHHEVIHRGRPACDFIRGWLHYCLEAYVRIAHLRPGFFSPQAS